MNNLKPKVRDLITAVLTAILMFFTQGCSANISGEKLDAGVTIANPVDTLALELAKPE